MPMMMVDPNHPMIGDRVKVNESARHEPEHDEGIVRQVVDGALGVEFDSMPGMVHQWYVSAEVVIIERGEMVEDGEEAAKKKKRKMPPMKMDRIMSSNRHGLPRIDAPTALRGISWEPPASVLARWNAALAAKDEKDEDEDTINIYDVIGLDPWTGSGMTAKRIAGILRNIGKKNVTVNINSPGGDLFEGIAIYNLLRDHDGEVTIRVIGLAASAASVIAMAGDKIQVARAGFMMLHNVWVMAVGNRNDLREAADQLETFDDALAGIYAARTEQEKEEVAKMMDKETWFSGDQAIESGFADELLPADAVEEKEQTSELASLRSCDVALAKYGVPRSQRRALINRIKELSGTPNAAASQHRSTPGATPKATQDAGDVEAKAKHLVDSFTESLQTS